MLGIGNYLWRLVPANPILLRVVETGGKRKRDLFIRCGYLGVLLFLVIFLLFDNAAGNDLAKLTRKSADIFYWMSTVQLALVALLAPVFTASAITQEKDSQTYDILLSTPLTNGQIVLGSLLSRLFFVVTLLISGIPIFSITQIFGGVAIKSIVIACGIACATAFITGSLAMAIACLKVGTRRTIFSFYLFILLYIAIPMALDKMGYLRYTWQSGPNKESYVSWFAGVHPFLAQRVIFGDPAYQPPSPAAVAHYGRLGAWYLSSPHTFFISLMFFLSIVLVTPSILLLRRLAQSTFTLKTWVLAKLRISAGDRTRKPRHVWSNPIAWREAKTKASASRAVLLRYGFMVLGIAGAIVLIVLSNRRVPSDSYIAFPFDEDKKTISIVRNGAAPEVFRMRTGGDSGGPTVIYMGADNERKLEPKDLREGMVVEPNSINAQNRVIGSMKVGYPKMALSQVDARRFLLGAIMVEAAVIMLILTQSAASAVTREKEDGTLDLLLTTPITSRYYIWGKLRGLVSFVLPLIAVPVASVVLFVFSDLFFRKTPWMIDKPDWMVDPIAILVLPGTLVMAAAFVSILGMQMSLRCRRTVMAVMSSVGIVAGVFGGLWVCGTNAASSQSLEGIGVSIGSFSPFTLMALLVDPVGMTTTTLGRTADRDSVRWILFIAGWVSTALYGFIVYAMYHGMVKNFDMTIRRQSS